MGRWGFGFLVVILLAGCEGAEETAVLPPTPVPTVAELATVAPTETAVVPPPNPCAELPGALIQVSMQSQVGILLDEIPIGLRDGVVADLMAQTDETWLARAARQVRLTRLRLNFRNFADEDKGQLPLPPEQLWNLQLDEGEPTRQTIQGHDVLLRGYTFEAVLLKGADDPAAAESSLANVGGVWEEYFILPIDPDLLLQRLATPVSTREAFPPTASIRKISGTFMILAVRRTAAGRRAAIGHGWRSSPVLRLWRAGWARRQRPFALSDCRGRLSWLSR